MGREIKFRAWYEKDKQMINWFTLTQSAWNTFRGDEPLSLVYEILIARKNEFNVMQYTGLKDKNGIEIYEGDIVEWKIDETDYYFKGIVKWDENHSCFYLDSPLSEDNKLTYKSVCLKILGNIYENPEL